jgi:hypothetical protein
MPSGSAASSVVSLGVFVLVLVPVAVGASDVELLPEVTVQLAGAAYVPREDAFAWDTWIGGGAGVLRVRSATAYFTADVETVLGQERRAFDANQANYHLEGGLRIRFRRQLLIPFFHHVSRHVVDRPKTELVDWNLVGVRVTGPLPASFPLAARYAASVARTVHALGVGYEWELVGVLDVELAHLGWGYPYLRADARLVTVDREAGIARGDFVDFLGQGGLRFHRGGRDLGLFAAYEHRNDVFVLLPGARNRALFGLRIGFAPGGSAGPTSPIGWPERP